MNRLLENAVRKPGSYLISGPSEGRITREAEEFLQPVFCEQQTGCGRCDGCVSLRERTHPDLLRLDGTKTEQAAQVPDFLSRRPFIGSLKAVLIPRVDLMNEIAQNVLLKSVEEPPDDTLIVLGAVNLKAVLPTIRSRCLRSEAVPDTENAMERLTQADVPERQAEILLRIADGDFPGAMRLHEKRYFDVRAKVQEAISKLLFIRNKATSRVENLLTAGGDLEFVVQVALLYLADVMNRKYLGEAAPLRNVDIPVKISGDARISARRLTRVTAELADLAERLSLCKGLNKILALSAALLNIVEDVT